MKSTSRFIAAFMLLAWTFSSAHLALEHGGAGFCEAVNGCSTVDAEHQHDGGPASDSEGDHHHHDLGAATAAQLAKSGQQKILAPQWVPILDRLIAELAASAGGADALCQHAHIGDSPPDSRVSGWLFVVQTALPVRGPSLAA